MRLQTLREGRFDALIEIPYLSPVQPGSFPQLYSTKTDDELRALAADQNALTAEARRALHHEISIRNLRFKHPSPRRPDQINLEENPAFNTPARISYLIFAFWEIALVAAFLHAVATDPDGKQIMLTVVLGGLALFGPIVGCVVWATPRALRRVRGVRRRH